MYWQLSLAVIVYKPATILIVLVLFQSPSKGRKTTERKEKEDRQERTQCLTTNRMQQQLRIRLV